MKRVLFLALVCCSARLLAQQDPMAFFSVGRGLAANSNGPWKLDLNVSVLGGYRVWSHLMVIVCLDYTRFLFTGYYEGDLQYSAYRTAYSALTGAKLSLAIPEEPVSPYFVAALGFSSTSSNPDSIFRYTALGSLVVMHVKRGATTTVLAAAGLDIAIYRGFSIFLEARTSAGFDSSIYDVLWMYRAGVGIAIY